VDKNFNYYVRGNNGATREFDTVAEFKKYYTDDFKTFKIGKKKILLTHDYKNLEANGYSDVYAHRNQIIKEFKPDFIICGHTHVPEISL
jgi:predicted phosphodiesterase